MTPREIAEGVVRAYRDDVLPGNAPGIDLTDLIEVAIQDAVDAALLEAFERSALSGPPRTSPSSDAENKSLKAALAAERAKRTCPDCHGSGEDVTPCDINPFVRRGWCDACHGEGRR